MHAIIVRWRVKAEHVGVFEAEMKAHVAATRRTEPGCLQFDVAADKDEPRTYHLFELYADDQALADHARSPTLAKIREKTGLWAEERSLHKATLWPRV